MNASLFSTRHVRATTPAGRPPRAPNGCALVLGGGGAAGNAWVIGVVAGLLDAGLDVTGADLVVGTSSGSTAAAQLTGGDPAALYDAVLAAAPPAPPAGSRPTAGPGPDHLERTGRIIAAASDPADMRRRTGAAAIVLAEASDGSARWRAIVAARLPGAAWPDRDVRLTAVVARSGEPVVFDRHSGVDLVDAVAASCAGGPAYRIGDEWYVDGGYRRNADNADLAAGYGRVLVLSPLGGRSRAPERWGMHLAAQVEELRAGGSRVESVLPDDDSLAAFGANMTDLSTRAPAARAGWAHARALAARLAAFWAG